VDTNDVLFLNKTLQSSCNSEANNYLLLPHKSFRVAKQDCFYAIIPKRGNRIKKKITATNVPHLLIYSAYPLLRII